jgi:hypothetical protein
MANYLIQTADARHLDALEVMLAALLNANRPKSSTSAKIPPADTNEIASEQEREHR